MSETVTLDAMINRDDFAIKGPELASAEPIASLSIESLSSNGMLVSLLRKPDFQRETNHWTPQQVSTFLESFLDNELIPALILWRSESYVFVIDGGHRLSALRAWIENDYGDGTISRKFFGNSISLAQERSARKVRDIIDARIGTYLNLKDALINPDQHSPINIQRARNMATRSLSLQWVNGDAAKAETSFFKINTQGTPLDQSEEAILKNRYRSVAIAARSIVRAATGHKYWSKFDAQTRSQIEAESRDIHNALFNPEVDHPIKTLDLPLGGTKSPVYALEMLMNLISITNAPTGQSRRAFDQFDEDKVGEKTLKVLKDCSRVVSRLSGTSPGSLGLHPAVYFYSERGRHIPDLLLGMLLLFRKKIENNDPSFFVKFTKNRAKIESYLIDNKSLLTQALQLARSAVRYERVADMFDFLIESFHANVAVREEDIVRVISPNSVSRVLAIQDTSGGGSKFSKETKSSIFIRDSLKNSLKCPICAGFIDSTKSASYDHVIRVQDGGSGSAANGQITHPYCNTSIKN